jgi:hypothetical protein
LRSFRLSCDAFPMARVTPGVTGRPRFARACGVGGRAILRPQVSAAHGAGALAWTDRRAAPLFGNVGVLFDWWDQTGAANVLVIPEFIWEAFLGIYCAGWGSGEIPRFLRQAHVDNASSGPTERSRRSTRPLSFPELRDAVSSPGGSRSSTPPS